MISTSFLTRSTQLPDLVQKCDAKRPCTRCVEAESASECVYDDRIRSLPHSTVGPLSGKADPAQLPALTPLTDDVLPPAKPDLRPPVSHAAHVVTYDLAVLQEFEPVRVPRGQSSGLVPFRRNPPERHLSQDTNPSISIISSFLSPEIPPKPRVPLSFLGEERLQVSDADTTDIDMRSYVFGLIYTRLQVHLQMPVGCGCCSGYTSLESSSSAKGWTL